MTTHHTPHPSGLARREPDDAAPAEADGSTPTPSAPTILRTSALTPHLLSARLPAISDHARTALRRDISTSGILSPIEVTPDHVILDGHARVEIATDLGLAGVPIRIVETDDQAGFILARAVARRNLTVSQRAALAVECESFRQQVAQGRARQRANLTASPDVAALPHRGARSRELAARAAEVSPRTIQNAVLVRDADDELFARVMAGEVPVDRAARQIQRRRRHAEIAPAAPMPGGPFDLIYADPPWQMGASGAGSAPEDHYPTMTTGEIAALVIPAAEDCALFLWAVNSLLPEALEVMHAWGFTYRANLCWVKPSIGPGNWARQRHELLLVGTRGAVRAPFEEDRPDSVIEAPRGRHSAKPEDAYLRIERAYPELTKCELFARGTPRSGWTAWGNEVIA